MSMTRNTKGNIRFAVLLLLLAMPGANAVLAAETRAGEAEQRYREFRSLYASADITSADLHQCLALLQQAWSLSPDTYKYAFATGAVHEALKDHEAAYQWYSRAQEFAGTAAERQNAEVAAREALFQAVQVAASTSAPGPEVNVFFILKGGFFEPPEDGSVQPTFVPEGVGAAARPAFLQQRFAGRDVWSNDSFWVVAVDSGKSAERHYVEGVRDFHAFFTRHLFGDLPPDTQFLVVVGDYPEALLEFTRTLYPDSAFTSRAPFMGYYNRRDNLLLATVYGGYGTLLHEMMHGLVSADFPEAPGWLDEGLATLYDRTQWRGNRLVPLPNWRLDNVSNDDFHDLAFFMRFAGNPPLDSTDLAALRMLYMYLDETEQLRQFYERVKATGSQANLPVLLAELGVNAVAWSAWVERTRMEYLIEVGRAGGALTNPAEIRFVQRALNALMNAGLDEDGLWGDGTRTAVEA